MAQLRSQDYEEELARLRHIVTTESNEILTKAAMIKYFAVSRAYVKSLSKLPFIGELVVCNRHSIKRFARYGIKKPEETIPQILQA
jgi:hypothetical protein